MWKPSMNTIYHLLADLYGAYAYKKCTVGSNSMQGQKRKTKLNWFNYYDFTVYFIIILIIIEKKTDEIKPQFI